MGHFSIGIISDIHFGKDATTKELCVPGNSVSCNIDGAAPYIDSCIDVLKKRSIKYLLVAGDLTSYASPEEFIYCEETIIKIASGCGVPVDNIIYCLGNHDVDWSISGLYEQNGDNADENILNLRKKAYQKIALSAPYCIFNTLQRLPERGSEGICGLYDCDDMVVFVLNTNIDISKEQSEKRYSHGVVGDTQLKWLDDKAASFIDCNKTKILLMHHHPYNYKYPLPSEDISTVKEGPELLDIVGKTGIDYIIHGHRHHPFATVVKIQDYSKPISIVCAGSFGINPEERLKGNIPNMLHVLEINDTIGHLYTYEYNLQNGWIIRDNSQNSICDIDSDVYLGKIVNEETIRSEMKKYISDELQNKNVVFLNSKAFFSDLLFLSNKKANSICAEIAKEMKLLINGRFPDEIVFIKG